MIAIYFPFYCVLQTFSRKTKASAFFHAGISPSSDDYKKLVICALLFLVVYTFCWPSTGLKTIPGLEEEGSDGKAEVGEREVGDAGHRGSFWRARHAFQGSAGAKVRLEPADCFLGDVEKLQQRAKSEASALAPGPVLDPSLASTRREESSPRPR